MPLTPQDVRKKTFTPVRLREGYDMGEVDQFLDEVEQELTRLLKANEGLREHGPTAADGNVTRDSSSPGEAAATAQPEPAAPPAPAALPAVTTAAEASSTAVRLLEIASNNAEQLINDAKADAERIVGEAHAQAEGLGGETAERRQQLFADLEEEKQSLSRELDELRAFEREYRSRLRRFLEAQLLSLDGEADTDGAPASPPEKEAAGQVHQLLKEQSP
jgi:DivIVA domain-containing protein